MGDAAEGFKHRPEVFALVAGEGSGVVLPNEESGSNIDTCPSSFSVMRSHLLCNTHRLKEEAGPFAFMDALLLARHGQVLTWTAEGDDIHCGDLVTRHIQHTAEMLHVGEPGFRHPDGIWFDLRRPHGLDAVHRTRQRESAGTIEETAKCHHSTSYSLLHITARTYAPVTHSLVLTVISSTS